MASTKVVGNAGEVQVPTATAIHGIKSWTVDLVFETGETTSFDDTGTKAFIPTVSGWSGSFEGYKRKQSLLWRYNIVDFKTITSVTTQRSHKRSVTFQLVKYSRGGYVYHFLKYLPALFATNSTAGNR